MCPSAHKPPGLLNLSGWASFLLSLSLAFSSSCNVNSFLKHIIRLGLCLVLPLAAWGQLPTAFWEKQWAQAGVGQLPNYSRIIDVTTYGAVGDSTTNCSPAFAQAIAALAGRPGVLWVPAGHYRLKAGLNLPSQCILRGDGSANTSLIFDLGNLGSNNITVTGSASSTWHNLQPASVGDALVLTSAPAGLAPGDYVQITQENVWETVPPTSWAARSPGQINQVRQVQGGQVWLAEPLRLTLTAGQQPRIRKITPKQWVGIENLRVTRLANAPGNPFGISFTLAANCWVEGVESHHSAAAHVIAAQSTHLQVRGCYFHDGYVFDGTGTRGYGVTLIQQTGMCLIENNVFRRLRHMLIAKEGANGNVMAYNYCREPFRSEVPDNAGADLLLHGFWPTGNLFEGNVAQFFQATGYWGPNGPYNTLFRNRLELYGLVNSGVSNGNKPNQQTDSLILLHNDVTGSGNYRMVYPLGNYSLAGAGHIEVQNRVRTQVQSPQTFAAYASRPSLYLTAQPEWWGTGATWGSIGLPATNTSGSNMAQWRWNNQAVRTVARVLPTSASTPPSLMVRGTVSFSGRARGIQVLAGGRLSLAQDVQIDSGLHVRPGGTLLLQDAVVKGTGFIKADSGATLVLANGDGLGKGAGQILQTSGDVIIANGINLAFTGMAQQTGIAAPARVQNLVINRNGSVRMTRPMRVHQLLHIEQGQLDLQGQQLVLGPQGRLLSMPSAPSMINASQMQIERLWTAAPNTWQTTGAVVAGQAVGLWAQNNLLAAATYDTNSAGQGSIWFYRPWASARPVNTGYVKPGNSSQLANPGQGAMVFCRPLNAAQAISFQGVPHTGIYTSPQLDWCTSGCALLDTNGWNLVANPFLNEIDWNTAGVGRTQVGRAIYTWSGPLNQWRVFLNGMGTYGFNGLVKPSESFFVWATGPNAQMKLDPQVQVMPTASALRQAGPALQLTIDRVDASGNSVDQAIAYEAPGATTRVDPEMDAPSLSAQAHSLTLLKGGKPLSIMGTAALDGITLKLEGTGPHNLKLSGTMTDSLNTLNAFGGIYLVSSSGQTYDLNPVNDYITAGPLPAGVYTMGPRPTSVQPSLAHGHWSLWPNPARNQVHVKGLATGTTITVTDVLGKTLPSLRVDEAGTASISHLKPGVYLLRSGRAVQRLVVE